MSDTSVLSSLPLPGSRNKILELVRSPEIRQKIVNAGFFNVAWLICVVGREQAVVVGLGLTAFYYLATTRSARHVAAVFVAPAVLGILVDTLLTRLGIFQFAHDPLLIPLWLGVLWFAFASTLSRSLDFLLHRPVLTCLLGGLGFAFSYGMGYRLGAVEFGISTPVALLLVGATWAVLLPMVYAWLRRFA